MTQTTQTPWSRPRPTRSPDQPVAAAPEPDAPDAPVTSDVQDAAPEPDAPVARRKDWRLGTHFLMRVSGLAVDAVHLLRAPGLRQWAEEMLDAEEFAAELHDKVMHLLGDADGEAGGNSDSHADGAPSQQRKDVIWLRRRIAAGKSGGDPERIDRALAAVGADAAGEVRAYLMHRTMMAGRIRDAAALAEADSAAARTHLRALGADARLRQGLQLATPTLNAAVDGYLEAGGKLDKRTRRVERSMLEYIYRMACKTTPFSRFTGVGLGTFTAEGDKDGRTDGAVKVSERWISYPRINVSLLTRLGQLVLENHELRRDVALALTPGWRVHGDSVRYVRRSVQVGSTENTVSFDTVNDSVFVLQNSSVLERVIGLFESEDLITWNDLCRELALSEGGKAADYDEYLAILTRLGLLQPPDLAVDIHASDPLLAAYRSAGHLGPGAAEILLPALSTMLEGVERFGRADLEEREHIVEGIRASFLDTASKLGFDDEDIPKTVLFEDVRIDTDRLTWDETSWRDGVGRSLERFEQLLPSFDSTISHKIILKGFFLARYGKGARCDDLLKLVNDFNEDIFEQYITVSSVRRAFEPDGTYLTQVNWLQQDEIDALDSGRLAFARGLRRRYEALEEGVEEMELDDELLDEVGRETESLGDAVTSRTHFVQMSVRDGKPLGVLNRSYGALRFPFSRFTHCFDDLHGGSLSRQLRDAVFAIEPSDGVFAEVTGGQATTNLNLHGRLIDHEIVCPGEWSSAPRSRQIEFEGLYVEHDEKQDRLVLREKSTDREVLPVYLGYLVPVALSDVPRTLLLFSQSSTILFDPWSGIPSPEGREVVTRPRLRVGDLVVARRTWTVLAENLPLRDNETSEQEWFLGWRRWRRANGLPDQTFARVHNPRDDEEQVGDYALARKDKPQYTDFDSPLSLALMERRIQTQGATVVFEEVLPVEDGLHVRSKEGHHAAEMVIETATVGRETKGTAGAAS